MKSWILGASLVLGLALVLTAGWRTRAADKGEAMDKGAPAYTVVATDGSHLIVTDNRSNQVYFYAIGAEAKIGDPLELRGKVDLNTVGKEVLTPTTYKKK